MLITAVVFDGKNYDLREKAVQTALRAKNKLGFIEGTLERLEKAKDQEFTEADAWDMANSMLCSWLLNIIDPKLHMSVAYTDMTFGMWKDLKERYSVVNAPKIHQLNAGIANCKQGTLDVGEFYHKLVNLWHELNNHIKVPYCTCKGCSCGAATKIVQMYEEHKSHQFLMGINDDEFSSIRNQILAQEPLSKLDRIFNMVIQEETHKHMMVQRESKSDTAAVFAVNTSKVGRNLERPLCKHCGKTGHEAAACFELIGYPEGWVVRGRGRGGRGARRAAGQGRDGAAAYAAQATMEETRHEAQAGHPVVPGFTPNQVDKLLSLIETPKTGYDKL